MNYIIMFWILSELSAPTWCWVCYWIAAGCTILNYVLKAVLRRLEKSFEKQIEKSLFN